jgi:DNA-binding Lrp family transcriptional regulator
MAATSWKKIRVVVDLAVRDNSLSEKDFRWAVDRALTDNRTFDQVIEKYRAQGTRVRNLIVKVDRPKR